MVALAGGSPAFLALAAASSGAVSRTRCSPTPSPTRATHTTSERLADHWAKVLGGPPRYSESFGLVPAPISHPSCQTTRIGHHGTLTEPCDQP